MLKKNFDSRQLLLRFHNKLCGVLALLLGLLGTVGNQAIAQTQPNIIYIFVDDLSSGMVGFTNPNTVVQTPNLDALATAGLQFTRAYANAVCSPSRGSLYTGYHLGHTINDENVENFRSEDIMPGEMMKAAGYATAVYGKWGYGSTAGTHTGTGGVDSLRRNPVITDTATLPTSHGYDDFVGYLNHVQAHRFFNDPLWKSDSSSSSGVSHFVTGNNAGDNVTNTFEGYTDDHHTRAAMQFITNSAAASTPFMIQMHYNSPHPPFDPGEKLTYDFEGNPRIWDQDYQGLGLSNTQRQLAVMITRMDEHVGALVNHLVDPNGDGSNSDSILQNTVVMFTSDNGGEPTDGMSAADWAQLGGNDIYGLSLRGGKRDLYEGGIRVPAFAFWAGTIAANQFTDERIDLADFMPTVADLGGIDAPIGLDGVSYAGLLTGEGMARRRSHFVWEHREGDGPDPDSRDARWSVLKDNFKLIHFSNGSEEMYDLNTDPSESQPLNLTTFADLRTEFQGIAAAEGITQPADGYSVLHVDWVGGDQDSTTSPANWSDYDPLQEVWVSVIANNQSADSSINFANADFLGIEVKGNTALQTIRIDPLAELVVRNELRIGNNGRTQLDAGTLNGWRWLDVQTGGQLTGIGDVSGQLYNWGLVAPGLPADLTAAVVPDGNGNGNVPPGITLFDPAAGSGNEPTENVIFDGVLPGGTIGTLIDSTANPGARGQNFVIGQPAEIGGVTFQANGTQSFSTGDEMTVVIFSGNNFAGIDQQNVTPAGLATAPGIAILCEETFQLPASIPNDNFLIIGFANPVNVNGGEQLGMMVFTNTEFTQSEGTNNGGGRLLYRQGSNISLSSSRDMRFSILGSVTGGGGGEPINFNETGRLSLDGDFHHQPGAELLMQISGDNNSNPMDYQFDQLVIDGTFTGGGSLAVELLPNYVPQDGDTITLIQADDVVGDFSNITVGGTPANLNAELQIINGDVVLTFGSSGPTIVNVDGFNLLRGVPVSGGLVEAQSSDDSYLKHQPGFTLNSAEAPVWLVFDGTLPSDSPVSLMTEVESSANTPGITQTVEAFDWTTGNYSVIGSVATSFNTDTFQTIDISGSVNQFVESGTSAVRTRIGWRQTGFTILFPWTICLDQTSWIAE